MTSTRNLAQTLLNSRGVPFGVVSTAGYAVLGLIDPNRLRPGARFGYRLATAALGAYSTWAFLRTEGELDGTVQPQLTAGLTAATAGAVLAGAEVSEAFDARLQRGLQRAGVRRPRVLMALSGAAIMAGTWWLDARRPAVDVAELADWHLDGEIDEEFNPLPNEVREIVAAILDRVDGPGAAALREQLATANFRQYVPTDEEEFVASGAIEVDASLPLAVPGTGKLPVVARFHALEGRSFDVVVWAMDGRLDSIAIQEGADWRRDDLIEWEMGGHGPHELGAWPALADLEFLVETPEGLLPA